MTFRTDPTWNDGTDGLANAFKYYIDFFHIPTSESVQFKAFLTSLDDSFESDWNSEDVYGRMDPIQTFKGTKRTISIEWELVAGSIAEAQENLQRCTTLFGMLYPVYSAQGTGNNMVVSAPPLFKVRFINLVRDASSSVGEGLAGSASETGLVCTMGGFNYSPDVDAGFLHAGAGTVYPQTIKLTADLTVMHTHGLGYTGTGRRQENFPYGATPQGAGAPQGSTGSGNNENPAVAAAAASQMTGDE